MNIIEIVKKLRYFRKAINLLIGHNKRYDLKERSRYITIDPEGPLHYTINQEKKLRRIETFSERK